MSVIEVEKLVAGYGRQIVLQGINWKVERGDFWAIMGPNGSGKTTLLRVLMGSLIPVSGTAKILGRDVCSYSKKELARHIAVLLQGELYPVDFTVEEYVLLGRYPYLSLFRGIGPRDMELLEKALEQTDTSHLRTKKLFALSSGEFQRVRIARALLQEPEILALDEPTVHLDIDHVFSLMELLRSLVEKGMTVIAVLHDLNMAVKYASKGLLLKGGYCFAQGEIVTVLSAENIKEVFGVEAEYQNGFLRLAPRKRTG